jgi:sn-glycerol 3-phosphate transport system substrate-binding protein
LGRIEKVANALVIKENGEYKRYGYTMVYDSWYPLAMITQAKGKFFNDVNTSIGFNNGEGVKVFSYLKELQSTGALYYPPAQDSGNIVNQMFLSGKVGMMFQSTGVIGSLKDSAKFEYVTAFLAVDTNKNVAWSEVVEEFNSAIQAIMYDNKNIQTTLDTFKKETERILKK